MTRSVEQNTSLPSSKGAGHPGKQDTSRSKQAGNVGATPTGSYSVEVGASPSPVGITAHQLNLVLDTKFALVELMRAMRKYGRPSKYPDDLRAAWNECERVVGDQLALEIDRERAA